MLYASLLLNGAVEARVARATDVFPDLLWHLLKAMADQRQPLITRCLRQRMLHLLDDLRMHA